MNTKEFALYLPRICKLPLAVEFDYYTVILPVITGKKTRLSHICNTSLYPKLRLRRSITCIYGIWYPWKAPHQHFFCNALLAMLHTSALFANQNSACKELYCTKGIFITTDGLLFQIQMSEHNSLLCGGKLHDNLFLILSQFYSMLPYHLGN